MTSFDGPYSSALYETSDAATLALVAGVHYYWVTSTDFGYAHDSCDGGCAFTTSVTGPGTITAGVPEPSIWAMMPVGLGGVGAALRSRRRTIAVPA